MYIYREIFTLETFSLSQQVSLGLGFSVVVGLGSHLGKVKVQIKLGGCQYNLSWCELCVLKTP